MSTHPRDYIVLYKKNIIDTAHYFVDVVKYANHYTNIYAHSHLFAWSCAQSQLPGWQQFWMQIFTPFRMFYIVSIMAW